MRPIKFRAWDKKENKFIQINSFPKDGWILNEFVLDRTEGDTRIVSGKSGKNMFFTLDGRFVSICPVDDLKTCATDDSDRYIIQQYTGLKDKNGKEIFEGDIVRDSPDGEIDEVIWEYASWRIKPCDDWLCDYAKSVEIIGNIYENPSLLEPGA